MRILIVKLYPSYELLNALPTVHRLRRDFNAEIHWVVHEHGAELVSCFDDVQRIIVYPEDELKHENRAVFRKSLHQETYDLVVDLQGNMQSALVCKSARKKKNTNVLGPSFQTEGACFMYTAVTGIRNRDRHPVDECMDVLRYLDFPTMPVTFPLRFPMPFIARKITSSYIVCALDTEQKKHQLSADFWTEVIRDLNCPVVLIGSRSSESLSDEIESFSIDLPIYNFVNQINLAEQGGLMQAAEMVIANNLLSTHIAAYVGAPTIGMLRSKKSFSMHPSISSCTILENPQIVPKFVIQECVRLREKCAEVVSF